MNFIRLRKAGLMPNDIKPKPQPQQIPALDTELPNGWTPPPASVPTHLQFAVLRSKNGWLPVYTHYRRNVAYTKVRHVYGDSSNFMAELARITDSPPKRNAEGSITTVEVKGNHVTNVRRWLASLGF